MPIVSKALEQTNISTDPQMCLNQVVSNVTGAPYARPLDPIQVRKSLAKQITAPVQWYSSMQWCEANGIQTFVELGPGNTLVNLAKQSVVQQKGGSVIEVHSLGTASEITDFLKVMQWHIGTYVPGLEQCSSKHGEQIPTNNNEKSSTAQESES